MLKLTERSLPAEMLRNLCGLRNALRTLLADAARRGGCARLCLGRAGVLSRLVEEPEALGKVAREALNLMHFDKVDKAIAAGDASLLANLGDEACVHGCYRCLLSYFNQPDHELIRRGSAEAKQMLIDLARGQVIMAAAPVREGEAAEWEAAFKAAGIPPHDAAAVSFAEQEMAFAWRSHYFAARTTPVSDAAREAAEVKGWMLIELPGIAADGVAATMVSIFGE